MTIKLTYPSYFIYIIAISIMKQIAINNQNRYSKLSEIIDISVIISVDWSIWHLSIKIFVIIFNKPSITKFNNQYLSMIKLL